MSDKLRLAVVGTKDAGLQRFDATMSTTRIAALATKQTSEAWLYYARMAVTHVEVSIARNPDGATFVSAILPVIRPVPEGAHSTQQTSDNPPMEVVVDVICEWRTPTKIPTLPILES